MLSVAEMGISSRADDSHRKQFPAEPSNAQRQWEALMIKTNTLNCNTKEAASHVQSDIWRVDADCAKEKNFQAG